MASSSSAVLFKDRDKFIKRQAEGNAFLAAAEKRQKVDKPASQKANRPKPAMARAKTSSDLISEYPSSGIGHKNRLHIMAKIVDKLQERFLGGQTESATLDEIVEEAAISVDSSDKHWLASSALLTNPKIDVETVNDVNRFVYKPPLDLKVPKKAALLNLLKRRHEKCEGAVTVEDVQDTLPKAKAQLIIDSLIKSKDAIKFTSNKKDVLFYADREYDLQVNQEFIEAWRKASVEGMDEKMLTEYLLNQGHNALRKNAPRPMAMPTKAKRGGRRPDTMKHNQHVADKLEDYSNQSVKK